MNSSGIVFWQNIISPHQIDFLNSLTKYYKIILIVDKEIDDLRMKDGWVIKKELMFEVYVNPINLDFFFEKENVHVFSGIGAYRIVRKGFSLALKKNAKMGLLSEQIDWVGIKGKLRYIKGVVQRHLYSSKIDFILAIGQKGGWWFNKIGYPSKIIYDFGYFVDINRNKFINKSAVVENRIIYVGRINDNKGVFDLLEAIKFIIDEFEVLEIYGRGKKLKILIKELSTPIYKGKVKYGGLLSNKEVLAKINDSKLLVIPSKGKDGWGVVVNEALLLGVPVIASSNVGSSYLLDGKYSGDVVDSNDAASLSLTISKWLKKDIDKNKLSDWANNRISPEISVHYFKEILDFTYHNSKNRPIAPWLK